jgi:hypothetical protein
MIILAAILAVALVVAFLWLVLETDQLATTLVLFYAACVIALMALAAWALFTFATNYKG